MLSKLHLLGGFKIVNYTEIVERARKGNLLVEIEPAVARKFFTNTDMKALESEIGQSLSKQSLTINAMMILVWLFMFAVDVASIIAFKWLSIAIIPVVFIAHFFYQSRASLGGQRLWGVSIFMGLCFLAALKFSYMGTAVTVFYILVPLPFLFIRLMYYLSCSMLRNLSLKNESLFNILYDKAIFIKEIKETQMDVFEKNFDSIEKSRKLCNISKVLGKSINITDLLSSLHGGDDSKERAEEELYNLCESDTNLRIVMQKYEANRETLKEIFRILNYVGAGQWTKGHFVSVSSLAFVGTLDYLLRNKEKLLTSYNDKIEISYRLITYFEKGEMGYIKD